MVLNDDVLVAEAAARGRPRGEAGVKVSGQATIQHCQDQQRRNAAAQAASGAHLDFFGPAFT